MRLTREQVAEVKACEGLYRASDVARHYGVNKSTVSRVWNGETHRDMKAAPEAPNVSGRVSVELVRDDILTLLNRGMKPKEVAEELGLHLATVYKALPKGVLL